MSLSFKNISKVYPGVVALNKVSLDIHEGEVLALMGENGAGKSTLVKCLTGANEPSSGEICIDGNTYKKIATSQSRQLGIEAVYQEFTVVPGLPVVENIFMGNLPGNGFLVDKKKMLRDAEEIFRSFKVDIDPDAMLETLSPAMMQIVEIAKAMSMETKILILDEPTAPLTIREVDILFGIIRMLKARNVSIIYISHRMEEIFEISDRIAVMRDGCLVAQMRTEDTNRKELIKAMIGRELNDNYYEHHSCAKETVVLEASKLRGNGVRDANFKLHKGEILGFAGLVGAGRTELMSLLYGEVRKESGNLKVNGRDYRAIEPYQAIERGIGLIPEDRKNKGLLLDKSVLVNITLASLKKYCRFGVIQKKKEAQAGQRYAAELNVKTPTLKQEVQFLSGGNQQKLIIAKWLAVDADILIFDEPTRGIDVGARAEIYKLMNQLVKTGKSILMVSSDFEELMGMSDRIIVVSEGRITGEVPRAQFDKSVLLDMASGNR